MPNALGNNKGLSIETLNLPAGGQKKANFSETLWFKKGAEGDDLLFDSDFELERSDLQDRYHRDGQISAPAEELREDLSLNRR